MTSLPDIQQCKVRNTIMFKYYKFKYYNVYMTAKLSKDSNRMHPNTSSQITKEKQDYTVFFLYAL